MDRKGGMACALWGILFQHKQRWQRLSCFLLPLLPTWAGTAGAEGGTVSLGLSPNLQPHTPRNGAVTFLLLTAALLPTPSTPSPTHVRPIPPLPAHTGAL